MQPAHFRHAWQLVAMMTQVHCCISCTCYAAPVAHDFMTCSYCGQIPLAASARPPYTHTHTLTHHQMRWSTLLCHTRMHTCSCCCKAGGAFAAAHPNQKPSRAHTHMPLLACSPPPLRLPKAPARCLLSTSSPRAQHLLTPCSALTQSPAAGQPSRSWPCGGHTGPAAQPPPGRGPGQPLGQTRGYPWPPF